MYSSTVSETLTNLPLTMNSTGASCDRRLLASGVSPNQFTIYLGAVSTGMLSSYASTPNIICRTDGTGTTYYYPKIIVYVTYDGVGSPLGDLYSLSSLPTGSGTTVAGTAFPGVTATIFGKPPIQLYGYAPGLTRVSGTLSFTNP